MLLFSFFRSFSLLLQQSWLVIACSIVSFSFYETATKPLATEKKALYAQEMTLKEHIEQEQIQQKTQQKIIKHQNDPEWIERLLIQHLGLVPEGYKKICFDNATQQKIMP